MTNFKDKLFENALGLYKEHWHYLGREDADRISFWLITQKCWLEDQDWIHELGDKYEPELNKNFGSDYDEIFGKMVQAVIDHYIKTGALEDYIYTKMKDYARDIAEEL